MSRAFVREDDIGADQRPIERPIGPAQNYITAAGLERLKARYEALAVKLAHVATDPGLAAGDASQGMERDLAWLHGRIERAIVVSTADARPDRVGFGATVLMRDEKGTERTVVLVGEDEADVQSGRCSWTSPLGQALMGAVPGDAVTWRRPAGDVELQVVRFNYDVLG